MPDSLDPEDWTAFRARAHNMLDRLIDRMGGYHDGPVWQAPDFDSNLENKAGQGADILDAQFAALLPQGPGNTHPRFFGWVHGAGTPSGLIADMVAATMNANCGGRYHAAIQMERDLICWALKAFGLPDTGSGLITTGTSMATIIALKAARDQACAFETRALGNSRTAGLVGYTSNAAHNCIERAFDLLGLGTEALRKVPIDAQGRMDNTALQHAVREDRAAGLTPFMVCATVGTVNRGAIDDLPAIAALCEKEKLWLHVDAAFAAALQFSPRHKDRLKGIEQADSLAFDFHKWMQVGYDAGCVLIRDEDVHRRAFSDRPDYLSPLTRGLAAGNPWPVEYGPELSRGFRALKVWAQIVEHGPEAFGRIVDRNIEQASYLAGLVWAETALELLTYDDLNICCFRYIRNALSPSELDSLNEEIVIRLQETGIAAPSTTRIDGRLAIRVNITNHRTRLADMDILVEAVLKAGAAISL